ncbi:hypothetical protein B484DRAFT_466840, partial [Ochromonadaceae sp. CCMP2298]
DAVKRGLQSVSIHDLFRLRSIAHFNQHAYQGKAGSVYSAQVGIGNPAAKQTALFPMLSKATHSCDPNCMYSSFTGVYGQYFATRRIRNGALLTFSYIDAAPPTEQRRSKLLTGRGFLCQCPRCLLPDPKSARFCAAECNGVSMRDGSGCWSCLQCQSTAEPSSCEKEIERTYARLKASPAATQEARDLTCETITKSHAKLPATHYLLQQLYALLSTFYASQAAMPFSTAHKEDAAKCSITSGLKGCKIVECQAANCFRGHLCSEVHPPSAANVQSFELFWQAMSLVEMSPQGRERFRDERGNAFCQLLDCPLQMILKYLPLLRIREGEGDTDVVNIERVVRGLLAGGGQLPSKTHCHCCGIAEKVLAPLLRCSRCMGAVYCSKECQKAHWKVHKKACKGP